MRRNKKGFTIIEVVLFLASSGLLFLVGFIGIGSRTRNVQATDSMRSLESFVQQELNEVVSGVNVLDTAGTDTSRIVMGSLFELNGATINVYTIVGDRLFGDQLLIEGGDNEVDLIASATPRIMYNPSTGLPSIEPYDVRWGSEFVAGYNNGVEGYELFGFLRSPGSSEIFPIAIDASGLDFDNLLASANYAIGSNVDLQMCYDLPNGQPAALRIAPGNQKEAIEVMFEGSIC